MAGQRMFTQNIPVLSQNEVINVSIPSSEVYLLSIFTSRGSVSYRAIGSAKSLQGTYNLSTSHQPAQRITSNPIETTLKSSPLNDGFSYEIGDSIRITSFLYGYNAKSYVTRVENSEHIHFIMYADENKGYLTDSRDGQTYKWVKIGNQVWMAENLNYASDNSWCNSSNATNCDHYGRLYTWAAVMNGASSSSANPSGVQGVCPTGWHVPSDAEWTDLVNYVDSQGYPNSNVVGGAGNALKSCHQVGSPLGGACNTSDHPRWNSHSTHYGTDAFGFSALPGGSRATTESFGSIGRGGTWWSSTESSSTSAWYWGMSYHFGTVSRYAINEANGFSLRCVRD